MHLLPKLFDSERKNEVMFKIRLVKFKILNVFGGDSISYV